MLFVGIGLVAVFGLLCAYATMRAAAIHDEAKRRLEEREEVWLWPRRVDPR